MYKQITELLKLLNLRNFVLEISQTLGQNPKVSVVFNVLTSTAINGLLKELNDRNIYFLIKPNSDDSFSISFYKQVYITGDGIN